MAMDEEEFKLSDEDIKWLLHHTEYDDKELNTMLAGEIFILNIPDIFTLSKILSGEIFILNIPDIFTPSKI